MNDLIKITQTQIGSENVNSVNSREIYVYLEIDTKYNDWINRAIEKYDFEENIDYSKMSNGTARGIDYIVSMDMAKELCMVSNTPKGKQTRKYFIQVEKQSQKVLSTSEQIALIAQGHQQTEQRLVTLEDKVDNDIPLSSAQKHNIKQKVNILVYQLKKDHNLHDDFMPKCYSRVWKKVKNHFIVSSYMEIPKSKFDELARVVDAITIADVV